MGWHAALNPTLTQFPLPNSSQVGTLQFSAVHEATNSRTWKTRSGQPKTTTYVDLQSILYLITMIYPSPQISLGLKKAACHGRAVHRSQLHFVGALVHVAEPPRGPGRFGPGALWGGGHGGRRQGAASRGEVKGGLERCQRWDVLRCDVIYDNTIIMTVVITMLILIK